MTPGTSRLRPTRKLVGWTISGRQHWKTSKRGGQSLSMKSSTTPSFWRAYRTLTPEIQAEARKAISFGLQIRVTRRCVSNAKELSGLCESSAAGERWRENMKAPSTGFGLAHTMSISD